VPYKRVNPVTEEEIQKEQAGFDLAPIHVMANTRYAGHHSICQVLREIYLETDSENIKLKTRLAMAMAKKMQGKLKHYRDHQPS